MADCIELAPNAHVLREDDLNIRRFSEKLVIALQAEDLEGGHEAEQDAREEEHRSSVQP